MIPTITPPTDNLYKFISLFGLTIFLFATFMLSESFNQSNNLNMKHEEIIQEIREIQLNNTPFKISLKVQKQLHPFRAIAENINKNKRLLGNLNIPLKLKYLYHGKLNVLQHQVNFFQNRILTYWLLIVSGILLMIYGFIRWNRKDQKFRDQMLQVELRTKEILEKHANQKLNKSFTQASSDLLCPACNNPVFGEEIRE